MENPLFRKIKKEGIKNISEEEISKEIYDIYKKRDKKKMKKLHDILINSIFLNNCFFQNYFQNYEKTRKELDNITYDLDGDLNEDLEDYELGPIQKFYRETVIYNLDPFFKNFSKN